MQPQVISVTERNILAGNNTVQKALVITYRVGVHGPFTLVTNEQDINSGAALQTMQAFANTLAMLPAIAI